MVVDVFSYNGEREILDLRLNILSEYVDKFIICEAKTTFTGLPKPLYFGDQEGFFRKFWRKIDYFIINEKYSPQEIEVAEKSPNTIGAAHWKHEFLQKESIKKSLTRLRDDDQVFIGDVDEIWEPVNSDDVIKLKLRVYAYYLNNRSSEEFWGPITGKYKHIKGQVLNHLRTNAPRTNAYYGWHFTSMGGVHEVRRKLNASYTSESYNQPIVQELLEKRVTEGTDYLGRDFSFKLDEREWPQYLREHKFKYQRLCK